LKTHILNLITTKNIRDALTVLMIAKPERVLKILKQNFNQDETDYIKNNLEEFLDFLDVEK